MEWYTSLLLTFFILIFLLLSGIRIFIALILTGMIAITLWMGFDQTEILAFASWGSLKSYGLAAIPLFVFMGDLIFRSGISHRIYSAVAPLMDRMPGGLLHSNIVAGALFAAASGSSLATTATIGTIALPEMKARGYHPHIMKGSILAGGCLGILIPPSITFIIYGIMVEQSVGRLFVAGVIPGIVLSLLFMGYIWITLVRDPSLAPKSSEAMPLKDALKKLVEIWPIIILIVVVLGTMYAGIATPTEAAAMGCLAGLIIAAAEGKITWKLLRESAQGAVRTTSMVVLVYTGAHLMGVFMTNQAVFQKLMEWTISLSVSPYIIYSLIMLMYLILGCFMSGLAAIVITLPLVYPIIMAFHFDPIWFGVVIVLQNEMGMLTPPVGSCLFVLHGLNPKEPFSEVAQGSIPFVIVIIAMLVILTIFPGLATWLPTLVFGPL